MTNLIVTPLNTKAPGSFRRRMAIIEALATTQDKAAKPAEVVIALRDLYHQVTGACRTDDGTAVEEALDSLSAAQFDDLVGVFIRGEETIPNASNGR